MVAYYLSEWRPIFIATGENPLDNVNAPERVSFPIERLVEARLDAAVELGGAFMTFKERSLLVLAENK